MSSSNISHLFGPVLTYPDTGARERLANLVGLDDYKLRLSKFLGCMVHPQGVREWANRHHPSAAHLADSLALRPPLIVLAGDVGSGKTELAEAIGDAVARQEDIDVTLYPLSLASRGQGRVGEMSQLLTEAFDYVLVQATSLKRDSGKASGASILLIDEADALAQSREESQMHHEDRAGVNALIKGVDRISNSGAPCATIMCTNRLGALDPAIKRRAADVLVFRRPDGSLREQLISRFLSGLDFPAGILKVLVEVTGETTSRDYGFTCSDITLRLFPTIVMDAYPDKPLEPQRTIEVAKSIVPTPPFREKGSHVG